MATRVRFDNGRRDLASAGRAMQTDDLGQYRIYNLPPGASFETEITVESQNRGGFLGLGGAKTVRISFHGDAAAAGPTSVLRDVETRLQPGRYRIRVRVKAANSGQTIERVRNFTVR